MASLSRQEQRAIAFETVQHRRAMVVDRAGSARTVKNLGWLLRHWKGIEHFEWYAIRDTNVLMVPMRDGSLYASQYASWQVFLGFVNRPIFAGLTVYTYTVGQNTISHMGSFVTASSAQHADLSRLDHWMREQR